MISENLHSVEVSQDLDLQHFPNIREAIECLQLGKIPRSANLRKVMRWIAELGKAANLRIKDLPTLKKAITRIETRNCFQGCDELKTSKGGIQTLMEISAS
jgi:hypothetical protein